MGDIDDNFDSPQAIRAMRKRHLQLGLELQRLGVQGLVELQQRGNLTAKECAELLAEGLKLEGTASPGASRKQH